VKQTASKRSREAPRADRRREFRRGQRKRGGHKLDTGERRRTGGGAWSAPRREGGESASRRWNRAEGPGWTTRGKASIFPLRRPVCKFGVDQVDLLLTRRADILSQFVQGARKRVGAAPHAGGLPRPNAGWESRSSAHEHSHCCRFLRARAGRRAAGRQGRSHGDLAQRQRIQPDRALRMAASSSEDLNKLGHAATW